MGVRVQGQTKGDYLHNLHRYLLNAYQKDERVVLIVDEAHGLNPELLEEIRLLSNLETSKSKLLQIVLVGQPELDKTLSQPEFRQLKAADQFTIPFVTSFRKRDKRVYRKEVKNCRCKGTYFYGKGN